jgi:hypothetical protein
MAKKFNDLKHCPFCGGAVELEEAEKTRDGYLGERRWWGVVCRNTKNRGGSCAIYQRPSASEEAAIERWNMRTPQQCKPLSAFVNDAGINAGDAPHVVLEKLQRSIDRANCFVGFTK